MTSQQTRSGLVATLLVASLLATTGCGDTATEKPEFTKLGALGRLFGQYRIKSRGRLPATEEDLRQFAATPEGGTVLAQADASSFDDLLISERDGQPVVLLFGEDLARQRQTPPIVAHEKEGADGERIVVLATGMAETVTDEELNAWIGNSGS